MHRGHDRAGETIAERATMVDDADGMPVAAHTRTGEHVGRYVVVAELGRGGMGVVHRAYDPKLRREVALKLLRVLGDRDAKTRMLREAQAMARFSHPNIVTVYDADEHRGEPYIAMQLVEGATLSRWLADERSWREIVDVLVAAGTGLAAAHEAGIVHRDFKPSNVIVGEQGRVWVTDFGIARALFEPATSSPNVPIVDRDEALTCAGTVVGTPAYMSPEVHEGAAADLRSDIYSFCVTAWEAFHGRRPFEGRDSPSLLEAKLQGPPPPPEGTSVPRRIRDVLARGLDPDPARRPPSMPALLAELGRDPARGTRHLIGGAGVVAVVAIAVIGNAWHGRSLAAACREEGRGISAVWNAESRARVEEGMRASASPIAEAATEKLLPLLDDYAERWEQRRVAACEAGTLEATWSAALLERSRACFDGARLELGGLIERLVRADAATALRAVPAAIDLTRPEDCADEGQLELRLDPDPSMANEVAQLRAALAEASTASAFGREQEAADLRADVLARARALGFAPFVAQARWSLGESADALGTFAEAERRFRLAFDEAVAAGADIVAFDSATSLVWIVGYRLGRYEEGLAWARTADAFASRLDLGPSDPRRATLLLNEGNVHSEREDYAPARDAYLAALEISESVYGADHYLPALALMNAGVAETGLGRYDAAEALLLRSEASLRALFGDVHPDLARAYRNLGNVDYRQGDYAGALSWTKKAAAIHMVTAGPDHPDTISTHLNMAVFASELGRNAEALELAEDIARRIRRANDNGSLRRDVMHNLGLVYLRMGRLDEAQEYTEAALRAVEAALGPDHVDVGNATDNLAIIARHRGDLERSLALHERALAIRMKVFGDDHRSTATSLDNIANVLSDLGRHEEALPLRLRALEIEQRDLGPDHSDVGRTLMNLGSTLLETGKLWESLAVLERSLAIFEAGPDTLRSEMFYVLTSLGETALALGRHDDALAWLERAQQLPLPPEATPEDAQELAALLARARQGR